MSGYWARTMNDTTKIGQSVSSLVYTAVYSCLTVLDGSIVVLQHTGNAFLVNNPLLFCFFFPNTNCLIRQIFERSCPYSFLTDCVQSAVRLNYICLKFFDGKVDTNNSYEMKFVLGREWKPIASI